MLREEFLDKHIGAVTVTEATLYKKIRSSLTI
jgi:hypothetical protein